MAFVILSGFCQDRGDITQRRMWAVWTEALQVFTHYGNPLEEQEGWRNFSSEIRDRTFNHHRLLFCD